MPNYGGSQLSRDTGLSQAYCSRLLAKGFTPDQIRDRGQARQARQEKLTSGMGTAGAAGIGTRKAVGPKGGGNAGSSQDRGLVFGSHDDLVSRNYKSGDSVHAGVGGHKGDHGAAKSFLTSRQRAQMVGRGAVIENRAQAAAPASSQVQIVADAIGSKFKGAMAHRVPEMVDGENLAQATLRKEIAIADQRELEVQRQRASLVSRPMVLGWLSEAVVKAREILLRIGPELRDRLAVEQDAMKVQEVIVVEVERALEELEGAWGKLEGMGPVGEVDE